MKDTFVKAFLDNCDIYYGDFLVSRELIIKKYLNFFSETIKADERHVSFALHTGSMCFDMVSTVIMALDCISYSLGLNEDILSTLNNGDMVVYKEERYHWKGLKEFNEKTWIILEQIESYEKIKSGLKQRTQILYDKNKHLIAPYHGESLRTDGRGIHKTKSNREEFLSTFFNIPIYEVPSVVAASVVVVAERAYFEGMVKNLKIVYGEKRDKKISLLDIIPASYYSGNNEEYPFGKNPAKSDPVLKVTNNISSARELILTPNENLVIGLLVTKLLSLMDNESELDDLLNREKLHIIHVAGTLKIGMCKDIINRHERVPVFACTKKFLTVNTSTIQDKNNMTVELKKRVSNIMNSSVNPVYITGGWNWDEYKAICNNLERIRWSSWEDDKKKNFIISAYMLLNLFITAVFSMNSLETAIKEGHIKTSVISPLNRLTELKKMAEHADGINNICMEVTEVLQKRYNELINETPKQKRLVEYLASKKNFSGVVVVPKAYYADILKRDIEVLKTDKWTCVTVNQFEEKENYDIVIVIGDIVSKRFDALQCYSSEIIEIFLYQCEEKKFSYRKQEILKQENRLNQKIGLIKDDSVLSEDKKSEYVNDGSEEIVIRQIVDFEQYIINNLNTTNFLNSISSNVGNLQTTEVNVIGFFSNGERILFSKYYKAIVLEDENRTVREVSPEELKEGNILVFVNRDNYTKNVVDFIYEQLISEKQLKKEIIEANEKSKHWKVVLQNYKEVYGLSHKEISQRMKQYGSNLKEGTIRQWLMEESYIVGPMKLETMEQIAELTKDRRLLENPKEYYDACIIVRKKRREILKLIEKTVNYRLQGCVPHKGTIFEVVYNNVERLSKILELEKILFLDESKSISVGLVNKPLEVEV